VIRQQFSNANISIAASDRIAMLVLFNKPFNVLSQFTDQADRDTLADYITIKNVYPAGRLDRDSEGLLLLTDHGKLQNLIASPDFKLPKSYWVQVEGGIDDSAIETLKNGVQLKDGLTAPAKATIIDDPEVWPRNPPIRERKSIPTSWIELSITEGRNRQVRRMTAAVNYPTLRLIRVAIGPWFLGDLAPGQYKKLMDDQVIETLAKLPNIKNPERLLLNDERPRHKRSGRQR
jgi:23S rRNA pseudouridine2457 synthase